MSKKTPLYDEHIALNAAMVDFSGWSLPIQYSSIIDEHHTTRTKAALFDISHMGEFLIQGIDSFRFLQKILTRDISALDKNHCLYSCMCNEDGGTVDDLFVYKFSDTKFMLVTNASTIEKDHKHLVQNRKDLDVQIMNISDNTAKIDIQGPLSLEIIQKIIDINLKRFEFKETNINTIAAIISRSGYTGEDGFELYLNKGHAKEIWTSLLREGKSLGLKPAGLGARDTLRLEACYSLYGNELNDEISPISAGIPFIVSMNKDFLGKNALETQPKKKIIAFEMSEKAIPRHNYMVLKEDKIIGKVTSGTMSPTLKKGIGLALIDAGYANLGNEIDINIRDCPFKGKIVKKPFYKGGYYGTNTK